MLLDNLLYPSCYSSLYRWRIITNCIHQRMQASYTMDTAGKHIFIHRIIIYKQLQFYSISYIENILIIRLFILTYRADATSMHDIVIKTLIIKYKESLNLNLN